MKASVSLDTLFLQARSHRSFHNRLLPDNTLQELYDILKWGPTSSNCCPARFLFVTSLTAREKLAACVSEGNRARVLAAPATAVIAMDMAFYDQLPRLAPHMKNPRDNFIGKPELIEETAFRNSTLQGAYLIMAARSLGLDCAPMSGFNKDQVDQTFFAGSQWKSNFICCLGFGDESALKPRAPRLDFAEACLIQ